MPIGRGALEERLLGAEPLLLDGATGTELERRGIHTQLPLWSARALIDCPELVAEIHADYAQAGCDALTANSFRTQRRTLARAGLGERAAELTARAVWLARRAAEPSGRRLLVLGSCPPLEDCYEPERVPPDAELEREHAEHVRNLVDAGIDAVLVEAMNTRREALAAVRAARAQGSPVLASFICWRGARLLSGESLADALPELAAAGASAALVNCLPPSNVEACLEVLARGPLPFGVYPNLGEPEPTLGFRRSEELDPEALAALALGWRARGARVLGGCCGTTPAHLAAMHRRLRG
jgi:enediyne biosynthesis protein CalE2